MQPDHSVEVRPLYSTASVLQRKGAPERYDFEWRWYLKTPLQDLCSLKNRLLSTAIRDPSSNISKLFKTISLLLVVFEQCGYPSIRPCLKFVAVPLHAPSLVVSGYWQFHLCEPRCFVFPPTPSYTYSLTLGNFSQHCKLRKFPIFPRLAGRVNEEFVQEDSEGFGTSRYHGRNGLQKPLTGFSNLKFPEFKDIFCRTQTAKNTNNFDVKMWRWWVRETEREREDVWGREREDVWRCVKMCEDVHLWGCEDVKM